MSDCMNRFCKKHKVEFVSYDLPPYNHCSGMLTIKIKGIEHKLQYFGNLTGSIEGCGKWVIDDKVECDDGYKLNLEQLICLKFIVNTNVSICHCGGCY